jgi:threonine aldolase
MAGGTVTPVEAIDEVCDRAHELGLPVHMDGARVFNAAAALGRSVREITAKADTVMFCLSKGLGAPVGSMVVGPKQVMDRARLFRKRLGGGMRQAGVLAAAGLIALEQMPWRLHEDHANACLLAHGLTRITGIAIDPDKVQTNILIFDVAGTGLTGAQWSARLKDRGVLANPVGPSTMRMVTHYDVSRADCETALAAVAEVAASA